MGNNQAMSNAKQKAESTGVFFSPPFSCSASLCEQLLAGGSGETPAYTLLEYCRITNSFYSVGFWVSNITIGRLPYYYFPSTCSSADRPSIRLEYCRITTSFLRCQCGHNRGRDWKTAVLMLPSTRRGSARHSPRLEDCRIITSFYSSFGHMVSLLIGILPYLYFLLLSRVFVLLQ